MIVFCAADGQSSRQMNHEIDFIKFGRESGWKMSLNAVSSSSAVTGYT